MKTVSNGPTENDDVRVIKQGYQNQGVDETPWL